MSKKYFNQSKCVKPGTDGSDGSDAGVGVSGGCGGSWESYMRMRSGFGAALCDQQGVSVVDGPWERRN